MTFNSYDTHTHLNDDAFYNDLPTYVNRAHELGVNEMNIVGYDAKGNQRALEIVHQFSGMHALLGFQPENAPEFNANELATLKTQLADPAVVGIGEIGLDYHWDTLIDAQMKAFAAQLSLARELNLPVAIHARDAMDDVYAMLKAAGVEQFGGVIHSFTGDAADAQRFLDLGMYISFSGIVTFKNAKDIQAAAQIVPIDRLLVETDAPFLAPTPYRGKQNEPGYVKYVVDNLASQLNMEPAELAAQTTANAHRLWRIK
ncbi:TatD family hydrolase [Periweissella fabalis]|uniref:TatD family hydrolase n=1 Tax=Periweissella fabalis TaxID=1070421 RepID=A0A7X6N374_9LACO|nr:TatD family hydrolase [Periweissella fabalis]MCM0598283.1 TatD family hydrolase [Periweissella fabalis]NKZ23789.1 TatD family hydrolase [Periweissella fabalis]